MKTLRNRNIPYLQSMVFCLEKVTNDGYTDRFVATEEGMQSGQTSKFYTADQVKLVNFFRFEGFMQPQENAILYVIETSDGKKGTMVDDFCSYAHPVIERFINHVRKLSGKLFK